MAVSRNNMKKREKFKLKVGVAIAIATLIVLGLASVFIPGAPFFIAGLLTTIAAKIGVATFFASMTAGIPALAIAMGGIALALLPVTAILGSITYKIGQFFIDRAHSLRAMAHLIYPNEFNVKVENQQLDQIGKDAFTRFTSGHGKRLHQVSEFILLPTRWFLRMSSFIVEPSPGENKGNKIRDAFVRGGAIVAMVVLIPFAIPSVIIGFTLRAIDHLTRPFLSYHKKESAITQPELSEDKPLHIRTHNVGFVPAFMRVANDLRDTNQRAKELVSEIEKDQAAPDVICFQEVFNEDATHTLVEGLSQKYPYIIHSVAPCLSGFNSGAMIASKHPILEFDFERFQHMQGPERLSPRGIVRFRLGTPEKPILIYSIHTQALIGEDRAKARLEQLKRVAELMDADHKNEPGTPQVLVGDFNSSRVTAWGEDNLNPGGQAEEKVLNYIAGEFVDPFLKDHDEVTGVRKMDEPMFLEADKQRLGLTTLTEPSGTWQHGPAVEGTLVYKSVTAYNNADRKKNKQPAPVKVEEIKGLEKVTWGTPEWNKEQPAKTARFDYCLFRKRQGEKQALDAHVEIRNIGGNQSAISDHAPVDAKIFLAR
jgi:endonuclease/exonuclease/phosphatase family metal-dependent hydrolase